MSNRSDWLDRIRAAAILAVVMYHTAQMSPLAQTALTQFTHYGKYGVDLFFALSGWLIGTLFWREYSAYGNVEVARFWARRALRTMPPYFCALLVHWTAVQLARSEPFDPGYLVFAQNYYAQIPFFLVSWSLCVEEHFYVMAPVISALLGSYLRRRYLAVALFLLLLVPPALRWLEYATLDHQAFGYAATATHLHMDGLIFGFALSFAAVQYPAALATMRAAIMPILAGLGLLALGAAHIGGLFAYVVVPSAVAVSLAVFVAWGDTGHAAPGASASGFQRVAKSVALGAYSIYLTHPLALHAARTVAAKADPQSGMLYWPLVIAAIVAFSAVFWYCVERPAISLRDRVAKRRGEATR